MAAYTRQPDRTPWWLLRVQQMQQQEGLRPPETAPPSPVHSDDDAASIDLTHTDDETESEVSEHTSDEEFIDDSQQHGDAHEALFRLSLGNDAANRSEYGPSVVPARWDAPSAP
jgi:hypothetical protein